MTEMRGVSWSGFDVRGDEKSIAEVVRLIHRDAANGHKTSNMDYGSALTALKEGRHVARTGWNGNGMWIELQKTDGKSWMSLPYTYLNYPVDSDDARGARVPWVPSQTDQLAEDWFIV